MSWQKQIRQHQDRQGEQIQADDPASTLAHRLVEIGQAVGAAEQHFISADQQPCGGGKRLGYD